FADRFGKPQQAARWRNDAHALDVSWQRLPPTGSEGMPTLAGLRVSTDAASRHNQLSRSPTAYRPPSDTMTPAAQLTLAHQALRQGRAEAVWTTLHHLWNRQASPGLYTWEAPRPTSNDVADGWQYARGWLNETAISPDYETAALLLLLQQDMLAYIDEEGAEPTVVIGAGITPAWLPQSMAVTGMALPGGSITWQWDGHTMRVFLRGPSLKVRLGAAFPAGTELVVTQKPSIR
ncbi:MAG TPA: hypothetical protein VL853_04875, partial [Gemmatimonadales bacterium]|nr:hypothetical protein [Gemmatimonadales bacterium]